jgi:hypothetical protein
MQVEGGRGSDLPDNKIMEVCQILKLIPLVAKTAMGKPLFKAPDGSRFEILWEREDLAQSELQQATRTSVLLD